MEPTIDFDDDIPFWPKTKNKMLKKFLESRY
jgi:hypothetical protein